MSSDRESKGNQEDKGIEESEESKSTLDKASSPKRLKTTKNESSNVKDHPININSPTSEELVFLPQSNASERSTTTQTNIDKPLEQWTKEEVKIWFEIGKYSKYYEKFSELDGKDLSELQKDDFTSEFRPILGAALYNSLQKLKAPSSASFGMGTLGESGLKLQKTIFQCNICFKEFYFREQRHSHYFENHSHDLQVVYDENDEHFVQVHHIDMAMLGTEKSKWIYLRDESMMILDNLERNKFSLMLQGPPGTGKSILVWLWACKKATTKSVLYLRILAAQLCQACLLGNGKIVGNFEFVQNDFLNFINDFDVGILIVDGITSEEKSLIGLAYHWIKKGSERSVIVVTSQRIFFWEEISDVLHLSTVDMPSWTLKEYQKACENEKFYNEVVLNLTNENEKTEKIIGKYFLAGGSARWMFALCPSDVINQVMVSLEKLVDSISLFIGTQGGRSSDAVNHLLQRDSKGNSFLVSEFVIRELAKKCEPAFVKEATRFSILLQNPSFDGWVFELDFLMQLRQASAPSKDHEIVLFNERNGIEVKWLVPNCVHFYSVDELKGSLIKEEGKPEVHENKKNLKSEDWLIPQRWNQGCYDAVQMLLDGTMARFVQVTRGVSHSLKLRHVRELLKTLNDIGFKIGKIEIVIVKEMGKEDVRISDVEGNLNEWGWKIDQLFQLSLKRTI